MFCSKFDCCGITNERFRVRETGEYEIGMGKWSSKSNQIKSNEVHMMRYGVKMSSS